MPTPTSPASSSDSPVSPGREAARTAALTAADGLLSPEGWVYASADSVEAGDPGRFHALFGRDSLIFALQVLDARPAVAAATLRALAHQQGTRTDADTEEQPGRILHEYRPVAPSWLVDGGWPVRDGVLRYYGSSDSTSWWLVVLDATGDAALQAELAPARVAAADWLLAALEAGRGFVRCGPRLFTGGLSQQGWRDTRDAGANDGGGIVTTALTEPVAPLADADSQAVTLAALDALTRLDPERAAVWAGHRDTLRTRIRTSFGAPLGSGVMALDGDDAVVDGAGSQLGWLLWARAWDGDDSAAVAERIGRPDVLTPYGVRTLSSDAAGFMIDGYHRGAIWPFDNWLVWQGLRSAGRDDLAERVRSGVLTALTELGRHPELYAVEPDGTLRPIAIANRVQAWTIGAVIGFTEG